MGVVQSGDKQSHHYACAYCSYTSQEVGLVRDKSDKLSGMLGAKVQNSALAIRALPETGWYGSFHMARFQMYPAAELK
jgi:hypothetical protein